MGAMPTFKVIDQSGSVIFEKVGGGQGNVNACFDFIDVTLTNQGGAGLLQQSAEQSADSVYPRHVRNQQELDDVLSEVGGPVFIDFMATWCGPCKAIAPYIIQQSQVKGIPAVAVDVDEAGELAQKYGISAMPTFKVIDQSGSVIFEKVGGGQGNVNACFDFIDVTLTNQGGAGLLQQSAEQSADSVYPRHVRNQQELDDGLSEVGGPVFI